MDKSSKTIWAGVGLVVVAAAFYAFQPSSTPTKPSKGSLPAVSGSRTATAGIKAVTADYVAPGEEKLHFDRLSTTPKNGFRPVIERRSLGRGANGANMVPNAVPNEFAGEGGWVYTGTAAIDNRPSALFENKQKNEAEYVTVGQKWKKCTVQAITSTTVTLIGPAGKMHVVDLLADPPENAKSTTTSVAVQPLSVTPMAGTLPSVPGGATFTMGTDGTAAGVPTAPATGGGGGRRRGGRRGGFGGGGGGGNPDQSNVSPSSDAQFAREPLPDTPIEN